MKPLKKSLIFGVWGDSLGKWWLSGRFSGLLTGRFSVGGFLDCGFLGLPGGGCVGRMGLFFWKKGLPPHFFAIVA